MRGTSILSGIDGNYRTATVRTFHQSAKVCPVRPAFFHFSDASAVNPLIDSVPCFLINNPKIRHFSDYPFILWPINTCTRNQRMKTSLKAHFQRRFFQVFSADPD
ncbi:hypothetical protein BRW84_02710 [Oxalobacter formigenes OXCC13]|nr:hypothetical protein BRW84_02710 [Oxalobacter formigenes OXCC13]